MVRSQMLSVLIFRTIVHLQSAFEQLQSIRTSKVKITATTAALLLEDIESAASRLPAACKELLIAIREETSAEPRLPDEIAKALFNILDQRRQQKQYLMQLAHYVGVAAAHSAPATRSIWDHCRIRITAIAETIALALHARHALRW